MWTDIDKLKYMTIAHVAFNTQNELHIEHWNNISLKHNMKIMY